MTDTTQDVSREREELAKWHDRQAKFRQNTDADTAAMHARTATALRTPHVVPGSVDWRKVLLDDKPTEEMRHYAHTAYAASGDLMDACRAFVRAAPLTPAPVSEERERCVVCGEPRLLVCGECVKAQYADALRTPHGLPTEEELALLMRQNLSVDVSNYGLSADIEGIEDAARAILYRLTASREDVK